MKTRFTHHKTEGQSIILIAVVLTVLIGMAALAVDLGQTYAEQRNIVRGTNAASLAGMNRLIAGGRDADIARAILESLRSNGVQVTAPGEAPQPGDRTFQAIYLGADGAPIAGGCSVVGACGSQRPQGVKYIQISLDGEVATYFARLFGQDQLPVGATAFSTVGACATGYYPIGVRTTISGQPVFDEYGFINYKGFYQDQTYAQLRFQRVYLRTETVPTGGFSLLRWNGSTAAGSTNALVTMLQGDGSYSQGYSEAPWPDTALGSDGPTRPASYPFEPETINATDWVRGNNFGASTNPFDSSVRNQLEVLKVNRTLMTLPMYRFDDGSTTDPSYYIERFGAFLLVNYGVDIDGVVPDGPWMELAYVREGGQCANLVTSAPPTTNRNLGGPVTYTPRYKTSTDIDRPVQFLIVLDVSGSMSWNFAGQGSLNGQTVTCTDPANACPSITSAWPTVEDRRIYIAKQVLRNFVNKVDEQKNNGSRPNDVVRIVSFSGRLGNYVNDSGQVGDNTRALNDLTAVRPGGWTNDKATLLAAIDQAGAEATGDSYMTAGATPSAVGMARASQVFANAPEYLGNQKYRRVVIFVTDGVANVLRNGMQNNYGENCAIGAENVGCQWGEIPGNPTLLKPLTALAGEAEALKTAYINPSGEADGAIYVVALGGIDETGLDQVASQPDYVYSATQAGSLQAIFNNIQANAIYGTCTPAQGPLRDSMSASEVPTDLRPELSDVRVGKATLTDSTGSTREAWIVADAQTRKLSYIFEDVPPGRYTMRAWLGYRAPEDNISRDTYELFSSGGGTTEIPVTVSSGQGLGTTIGLPISLDLNGSVCPTSP